MSCENDNALIAIIKSINQEVKKRIPNATEKAMCKKENMEIVLQIIDKHRDTVKLLGFSHHQFIYRMGVMNGVYRNNHQR